MKTIELIALLGISEFIMRLVFTLESMITNLFFVTKNKVLIIIGAPFAILGFPFEKFIEISVYMTIAQSLASSGRIYFYFLIAIILINGYLRFHHRYQKIVDRTKSDGYYYDMGDDLERWLMMLYYVLSFIYFVLVMIFPSLKWESLSSSIIQLLTHLTAIGIVKIIGMVYAISIIFTGLLTITKIIKFQKYTDNKLY